MSNVMRLLLAIILLVIFMGAFTYYQVVLKQKLNGTTLIDNPTNQAITVELDGQSYKIPPMQFQKVDLVAGKHQLACQECGLTTTTIKLEPVIYGVINPTRSKYVIYHIIFTENPDLASEFKPYQVDGREVYSLMGEPELVTDLFIPDLTSGKGNIDDVEPSHQYYSRVSQDYAYLRKIFRKNDFFEFYEKSMP